MANKIEENKLTSPVGHLRLASWVIIDKYLSPARVLYWSCLKFHYNCAL